MTTQNFHSAVGQVAGGDINNVSAPRTLWDCTLEELKERRAFSRQKKWQLQRKLIFSLPMAFLAAGFLVSLSNLVYGFWSLTAFGWEIHGWEVGMCLIATSALFFHILMRQTGKGIAFHTRQLETIDTIMQAKF